MKSDVEHRPTRPRGETGRLPSILLINAPKLLPALHEVKAILR